MTMSMTLNSIYVLCFITSLRLSHCSPSFNTSCSSMAVRKASSVSLRTSIFLLSSQSASTACSLNQVCILLTGPVSSASTRRPTVAGACSRHRVTPLQRHKERLYLEQGRTLSLPVNQGCSRSPCTDMRFLGSVFKSSLIKSLASLEM